jgi:nucleoside-triphosphate--adenylate kinase
MSIAIVLSARSVPKTSGFAYCARAHVRTFASGANDRKTSSFGLNTRRPSPTGVHEGLDHAEAGKGKYLRMLMFGKPGAGKGTLSSRLVQKYDLVSVSTGDLLRSHIQEKFVKS